MTSCVCSKSYHNRSCHPSLNSRLSFFILYIYIFFIYNLSTLFLVAMCSLSPISLMHRHRAPCVYTGLTSDHRESPQRSTSTSITERCVGSSPLLFPAHVKNIQTLQRHCAHLREDALSLMFCTRSLMQLSSAWTWALRLPDAKGEEFNWLYCA